MLVVDDRPPAAAGPAPGLHALVVGVSAYPHLRGGSRAAAPGSPIDLLGLEQLAAPALTAHRVHRWVLEHRARLPVPLHTVRLLLAPSAAERAAEPGIDAAGAGECRYAALTAALNDWRTDLARHRDSMALLFFSGHGFGGAGDDALMLAADFGEPDVPPLDRAISITDVEQGLVPPRPGGSRTIGRRQVYLVDACRNRPASLPLDTARVPTVWADPVPASTDDRELAILLATINSRLAYVGRAGEATVFGQAVLECLQGAAAEPVEEDGRIRWAVDILDVSARLPERMRERTAALNVEQASRSGRQLSPVRLVTFDEAPLVTVTFPAAGATPAANLQIVLRQGPAETVLRPLDPPQREYRLPMGLYGAVASAVAPPPPGRLENQWLLRPPRRDIPLNL